MVCKTKCLHTAETLARINIENRTKFDLPNEIKEIKKKRKYKKILSFKDVNGN